MKKRYQSSFSTSVLAGGLIFAQSLQATGIYDPGAVASMPQDTVNFVNRLNSAGQQAAYLQTLPNSSRGMRGLETYYRNRHDQFVTALNHNLNILDKAYKIVSEASRTGGPDGKGISDCLSNNNAASFGEQKAWSEFKNSFTKLGLLRQYAETSVGNYFPGVERPQINSGVVDAYNRVGAALDMSDAEGSFWQPINSCCARIGRDRVNYPVCNEDYVRGKLAILEDIKKLPTNFVDPMNPGPFAQTLTPEDIVDLMSLGQLQDFINAKDFNAQAMALIDADMRCVNSRDQAMHLLTRKGENRALIQTAIPALQCSLGNLLRNSSKTVRHIGMGVMSAKIPMFTMTSECSPETIAAAQTTLFYSPEAFKSDFEHLVALPTNMLGSQIMAKPIETYESDGLLTLELRDEAGYTREMIHIGDDVSPQYAQMQAAAARQAVGQAAQQSVSNTPVDLNGTSNRVAGRSVVNGVGASRANSERVLVRSLASKAAEGDLESARTLAGAVRGRKNQLKEAINVASKDKSLVTSRKEKRATEARGIAERAVVQEATANTAKTFSKHLVTLREAIGLTNDSGRVVERPGGANTTTSTSGSTVTSNLPALADRAANEAYKQEQSRRAIAVIRDTIRKMASNLTEVAKKVNTIIESKKELEQKIAMMVDGNAFKKIGDAAFDDRADIIMKRQDEIVRLKKEYYALNAQELGAKAVLATSKNSFLSYIEGAAAFQGLDVRRGDIRAPASVQQPFLTQQQNTSLFQMPNLPQVPGAAPPSNLVPPQFTPTPTQNPLGTASIFPKWFELFSIPAAHAAPMSLFEKRQRFLKEFDAFIKSYNSYADRVDAQVIGLKQQAWERFILNEREMRKEPLLTGHERMVMGAFNDTIREEVPDLVKAKVSGALSQANNMQLYQYIDQIRSDSVELNELVIKEATLANELAPRNPIIDDEVFTGILPSIALD